RPRTRGGVVDGGIGTEDRPTCHGLSRLRFVRQVRHEDEPNIVLQQPLYRQTATAPECAAQVADLASRQTRHYLGSSHLQQPPVEGDPVSPFRLRRLLPLQ